MTEPVRVLLVAGHPVILGVIRLSSASVDGLEIIGEAGSVGAAVAATQTLDPDVVVLDLELADDDGRSAIGELVAGGRRVLVLSDRRDGTTVLDVLRAGVLGYLVKPEGLRMVGEAVSRLAAGERVLDPSLDRAVIDELGRFAAVSREGSRLDATISPRERQILSLLAEGMTMRQIGRRLDISPRTVESHVSKIYRKLAVSSRVQAVARGAALGIIDI